MLALLVLLAPAQAQTLKFATMEHDFGIVKQKGAASYEFEFTNIGKDTAYLLPPRPGCGCTAAILSASVIPPKKSGKIGVEYHSYAGTMGKIEKNVLVLQRINGEERNAGTLTIRATVVGELIPDSSMFRFETKAGERVTLSMKLRSNTDQVLKLDNMSAAITEYADTTEGQAYHSDKVIARPLTDFTLRVDNEELRPGESVTVTLEVQTRIKGQMNGSIRIALPNTEIRIPVVGVVYYNKSPGK
ncbi:MAG: DUF1573 domain-containing protein [Ignavibacteria bacterium]|nr:DUF1573 domain-containing protein [Ignavibacteria bacterium]